MADYCKECAKMDTGVSPKWGDEYYCELKCKYLPGNNIACGRFVQKPDGGYHRAGIPWYITSIICKRLGLGDECETLKTTYKLKKLYFTEHNQEFLNEYDIIGPQISAQLVTAPLEEIQDLYQRFLVPCQESINLGLYEPAATTYQNMVEELKEKYLSPEENKDLKPDLGQARTRIRP